MHPVLVLFAHPALERSRVNRHLTDAAASIEGVTVHDLYQTYPDFHIDVAAEQQRLLEHETIVFHHPMFWYSSPAILKEWQDLVLTHGWAYGSDATALHGKTALHCITTGGSADRYSHNPPADYSLRELLLPFSQTCTLCGIDYLGPFAVHNTLAIRSREDLAQPTEHYRRLLTALRDGTLDHERARAATSLDAAIDDITPAP